jgi:hypothetical protein
MGALWEKLNEYCKFKQVWIKIDGNKYWVEGKKHKEFIDTVLVYDSIRTMMEEKYLFNEMYHDKIIQIGGFNVFISKK